MKKQTMPKKGEFIKITERKSGGLQKHIKVGDIFEVSESSQTDAGDIFLTVCYAKSKSKTARINSQRFSWVIKTLEEIQEDAFKAECAESTKTIMENFTDEEHLQIALVPLIYNQIAWHYALKAVDLSVRHRVEILKKMTRTLREVHRRYERTLSLDLDHTHQKHIENEAQRFLDMYAYDMTILYFTVNGYFKKVYPGYPYDDLRTFAIISILIMKMSDRHTANVDEMIRRKMGRCKETVKQPAMAALQTCMEAFAGIDKRFDFSDSNIQLCIRILTMKFNEIQFTIPGDDPE